MDTAVHHYTALQEAHGTGEDETETLPSLATRNQTCARFEDMAIPNAKKYRLKNPNGPGYATVVAVLPKSTDVNAYVKDAAARFDWQAWEEAKANQSKVRVGQQKQRKR